jgi:uncharacterized protein (DUF1330 family)
MRSSSRGLEPVSLVEYRGEMVRPLTDDGAERLNQEAFGEFAGRAEDGPVVMLNLLRFKPDGGAQRYAEYAAAVAPLLARVGGEVVMAGEAAAALIGDDSWDLVALARYPTRQAFLDMVSSPEYREIANLRTESLLASELHPMDPVDVPGGA